MNMVGFMAMIQIDMIGFDMIHMISLCFIPTYQVRELAPSLGEGQYLLEIPSDVGHIQVLFQLCPHPGCIFWQQPEGAGRPPASDAGDRCLRRNL